jgi:LPXTG-site transpeptidase (sortase) family protein
LLPNGHMSNLFAIQQERRLKQRDLHAGGGRKRIFSGWNLLLLTSYVMVALGIWGLVLIFGPVARVEAVFQFKQVITALAKAEGGLLGSLTPDIRFDLVKADIAGGYGIVIPTLYIQEMVIPQVNAADKLVYMPALKQGIAHAAGTALAGEPGLGYYFAHSSGLDAPLHGGRAVFYLLGKLEAGDEVILYRAGERYEYRVSEKKVVEATDLTFLNDAGDDERIVLQTCWPVGTSSKRLLVMAERV